MSIVFSKRPTQIMASTALTATGQTTAFSVGQQDFLSVMADVTAVSGAGASMTLSIEWSNDGATWFQSDPADVFTAISATGKKVKLFQVKGILGRVVYTISGTTPSLTTALHTITGS